MNGIEKEKAILNGILLNIEAFSNSSSSPKSLLKDKLAKSDGLIIGFSERWQGQFNISEDNINDVHWNYLTQRFHLR
ncbi:MAG: hypothetical protein PHU14_10885 [Methylovulum sp.]|nr:hypothetical protein [Methylovulum sp.]